MVEHSCMRNNDETVMFSDKDYSSEEAVQSFRKFLYEQPGFDRKRLVICRPVYQEEIELGLKVDYKGSVYQEKPSELTRLLDSLHRFSEHFKVVKKHWTPESQTPAKIVADYLASNYYDCMSSGCPITDLVIARFLCDQGLDLNEQV